MATLPTALKRNDQLLTLVRDPLTEKRKDGRQQPTRPMVLWMGEVNKSLQDLLFENVVGISDSDVDLQGNVSNFSLLGADVIRFTNTVDLTLTGIIPDRTSQDVILISDGAGKVDIANESTQSDAANRMLTGVRATISLAPSAGYARLYYAGFNSRWRVITHEQGAAITPPFLASDFATEDIGTWNVSADEVLTYGTYLNGSLLYVTLRLLATDVTFRPTGLTITLPQQYAAKRHITGVIFVRQGVGRIGESALLQVEESGRQLIIHRYNERDFVGLVDVLGQFSMEIGSAGTDIDAPQEGVGGPGGGSPFPTGPVVPPGGDVPPGSDPPTGVPASAMLPDASAVVAAVAAANPLALQETCVGSGGGNFDFMDALVTELRTRSDGARWGYNGQRGNVNDVAEDAITYFWDSGTVFFGSPRVFVVRVVGGHCGTTPAAVFEDITDYSGAVRGAFVFPREPTGSTGGGGAADQIDLADITWLHDPIANTDPSSWAKTSTITKVDISTSEICIEHTKAGLWPVYDDAGNLGEGNPWVIATVDGVLYGATYEWLRPGQICKGITAANIGPHTKNEPLKTSWAPVLNEQVGFMVTTRARDGVGTSNERSQIVKVSWPY